MTAKQVYEAVLVEMNKVNAPSFLLDDFNYLFNKAINQYINKRYNTYDVNEQSTDDLRVIKATAMLTPRKATAYVDYSDGDSGVIGDDVALMDSLYGATYEVNLPDDYLHILNCICIYKVKQNIGCHNANTYWQVGATRLTADLWAQIINNEYMKPRPRRPYYYIHNVNTSVDIPSNPVEYDDRGQLVYGTDAKYDKEPSKFLFYSNDYNLKSSDEQDLFINVVSRRENERGICLPYIVQSCTPAGISYPNTEINDFHFQVTVPENTDGIKKTYTLTLKQLASNNVCLINITQPGQDQYVYYGLSEEEPNAIIDKDAYKHVFNTNEISLRVADINYRAKYVWVAIPEGVAIDYVTDTIGTNIMFEETTPFIDGYTLYYSKDDNYYKSKNSWKIKFKRV